MLPTVAFLLQAVVQVHVATPTVRFEAAPELVEVEPGVMVVPEYDEEVFFVGGFYWYQSGGVWFRARDYRGGWVAMPPRRVPVRLVRITPGRYRHHVARPEQYRVIGPHGRVTRVKIKEHRGYTEVKVKEKRGHGRFR